MNHSVKPEKNTSLAIRVEAPVKFKRSFPGYSTVEVDAAIDRFKEEIQALDTQKNEYLNGMKTYAAEYQKLSDKLSQMEEVRANETQNLMLIMETAKASAKELVATATKEAASIMARAKSALQQVTEKENSILSEANMRAEEIVKSATEEVERKKSEIIEDMYAAQNMFADINNASKTVQKYLLNMFISFDDRTNTVLSDIQAWLPLNDTDVYGRQIPQATVTARIKENDEQTDGE